jgi:hypothetical protein
VTVWRIPRESSEWVGPITVTLTVDGEQVPAEPDEISLAVIPLGQRPEEADWVSPDAEPGGSDLGLMVEPVDSYQELAIWLRASDASETPVLEPSEVGYLTRT